MNRQNRPDTDERGRRRTLAPTSLAQYLALDSCDRFLRFYLYKGETAALVNRMAKVGLHQRRALQPFGPLLANLGDRVEADVLESLRAQGYATLDLATEGPEATVSAILAAGPTPVYIYQAHVSGMLGKWPFEGRADFIRVRRDEWERLEILVGDVKATRKDKVRHRLQVTAYVRLIQYMLEQAGAPEAHHTVYLGTVIRRDADGTLQDPAQAPLFDLSPYYDALNRLASAPDSALARVDQASFEDLHYYINQKCDGCLFNPICMVESAERQDIALVPFLESADKRALTESGVRSVADLAGLKNLPVPPEKKQDAEEGVKVVINRNLTTAPGKEELVSALAERWPVGPKLDRLIQRAARMLNRFQPEAGVRSYSYFFDADRSVLPDESLYPDLVKIFLDVQTDYLEDRVYLAGALVVGPKGRENIVRMTPGVPDVAGEREMLVDWVSAILLAVVKLSESPEASPVHLYLYNRHDQKALLEALRRHLDVLAALPALYELLTETPALTQSAVSFVYDEVKEQRNLASTGFTLQAVATQLGFKWNDGEVLYYRLFEQGMFDYLLKRASDDRYIESAARFYSTIPLEYAYAAWGLLRAEDFKPEQRQLVQPYLHITADHLSRFQAKRLEALAYIESSFRRKNSFIKKEPLNLLALGANAFQAPPFRRVLEEFLYIEHYANLQEHLQLFSQPITKRVQQGRALLLRCTGLEETIKRGKPALLAHFEADFSNTGLEPAAALQLNKLKPGDFVVLNTLESDSQAWEIVRGRIGVIREQQGLNIALDLLDMSFGKNTFQAVAFRYYHNSRLVPEVGELYTLDEMVDDLNGDKLLDACRNADFNPFYHLMALPEYLPEQNHRPVENEAYRARLAEFAALVEELEGANAPTLCQQSVIAGHSDEKIFLVQGPPGTGKSHTLGWAILARMYAARASGGAPLRVAISCQTHTAVNIVLQSVAGKLARLKDTFAWPVLAGLQLYKAGDETAENSLAGIESLDAWEQRYALNQIFNAPLVAIGATPGGLYKLLKQYTYAARSKEALWNTRPFDLVVLDEASQMNIPQALLASSWLREDGQLIVVGDHRQMAPILSHGWEAEDRMSAVTTQPYRSVFQFLLDHQFPRVALDESFRLHQVQAEFLQQNIYSLDGIHFHSRRRHLLPGHIASQDSAYLRAVMDPAYPVVVIQHNEQGSQQANLTEANLIAPLVETCIRRLGLDGAEGIGVVVPHRAQKALLRELFPALAEADAVDTVERFQGDEREVIIVSATASDPDYVLAEAEFLLNPNRLNVALSRPRRKLIVVASSVVFNFLSADLEIFDQAVLWKRLLSDCAREMLWNGPYAGTEVKVFGKPA
ncbi:MAG TPA: AAA domain-containing protein [Chloroflexia bacterium]|nr:AAA domain-containing protein [Chloroflexia bacterium]